MEKGESSARHPSSAFILIAEETGKEGRSTQHIEIESADEDAPRAPTAAQPKPRQGKDAAPRPAHQFLRNLIASPVRSHPIDEETVEEISPLKPQDISLSLLRPETERLLELHRQLLESITEKPLLMKKPQKASLSDSTAVLEPPFRSSTSCLLPAAKAPPPATGPRSPSTSANDKTRGGQVPPVEDQLRAIALCFHASLPEVGKVYSCCDGDIARVKEHFIHKLAAQDKWVEMLEQW